ncbi:hypothetical protein BsWGS_18270 [Bradybaena similaris]
MTAAGIKFDQKATGLLASCERKLQSSPLFISLIIATFILFGAVIVFNGLATNPKISGGLFIHGTSNVSQMYPLNITPAGWTFIIWSIIYILQLIWNIYSLALLCRSTSQGPAYLNPIVLSPAYFIFFSLSSALNITWLFLWDRLLFLESFIILTGIAVTVWLSVAVASTRLVMFKDTLTNQGRKTDIIFLQVVVINGLAMYATWTTIASSINLAEFLVYTLSQPVVNETACIISLGILSFIVVLYISLDVTVLKSYTEYSLTPYAVVIWALTGLLVKNYDQNNISSIISVALLAAVSLAFVIKLGITFYNSSTAKAMYKRITGSQQV